MLFNSYIFIFLFLPVAIIGYYGMRHWKKYRTANLFLIGMSFWFYGYFNRGYIPILAGSIAVNYLLTKGMERSLEIKIRKLILISGICINVAIIFYFKYYDFFIENINFVCGTDFKLKNILLPLGISFFTFQQISYLVDSYRGETKGYSFDEYALFVSFFPQLIAGPIVLHKEIIPQFRKTEKNTAEKIEKGIYFFILGLTKKVLLADKLGVLVDIGYNNIASLDSISALIVMLSYTFQIYFDFSGYCDMAVGIGWILGIDLPLNFNSPYRSHSVKEFWNRWHITLNRFFTEYLYIPLGGNRKGMIRKLLNIMIVFGVSGIWHGAAWTFVIWGIAHGIMVCIDNTGILDIFSEKVRWLLTFIFINFAWILFRSDSVEMSVQFYQKLFSFTWNGYIKELAGGVVASWNYILGLLANKIFGRGIREELNIFLTIMLLIFSGFLCVGKNAYGRVIENKITTVKICGYALLFVACVLSFSGVSVFLYFNF